MLLAETFDKFRFSSSTSSTSSPINESLAFLCDTLGVTVRLSWRAFEAIGVTRFTAAFSASAAFAAFFERVGVEGAFLVGFDSATVDMLYLGNQLRNVWVEFGRFTFRAEDRKSLSPKVGLVVKTNGHLRRKMYVQSYNIFVRTVCMYMYTHHRILELR